MISASQAHVPLYVWHGHAHIILRQVQTGQVVGFVHALTHMYRVQATVRDFFLSAGTDLNLCLAGPCT